MFVHLIVREMNVTQALNRIAGKPCMLLATRTVGNLNWHSLREAEHTFSACINIMQPKTTSGIARIEEMVGHTRALCSVEFNFLLFHKQLGDGRILVK